MKVLTNSALGSGAVTLAGGTLGLAGATSTIGVQFVGDGIPVTGFAGVMPMNNWNSLSGSSWSFANAALTDNSGVATGAAHHKQL